MVVENNCVMAHDKCGLSEMKSLLELDSKSNWKVL